MHKLLDALTELNEKYPRPDLCLEVSGPFDTRNPWNYSAWPQCGVPGVYVFADENNKVLYIGKASSTIGQRLSAYWCKGEHGETKSKDWKSENVRYVYAIGIRADRFFEAPSIEEFLISKVRPDRNCFGKGS